MGFIHSRERTSPRLLAKKCKYDGFFFVSTEFTLDSAIVFRHLAKYYTQPREHSSSAVLDKARERVAAAPPLVRNHPIPSLRNRDPSSRVLPRGGTEKPEDGGKWCPWLLGRTMVRNRTNAGTSVACRRWFRVAVFESAAGWRHHSLRKSLLGSIGAWQQHLAAPRGQRGCFGRRVRGMN